MHSGLADGVARELADAEAELSELRVALVEARAATRAAERKVRKRQIEEVEKLRAYERAEHVKEIHAAERRRIEGAGELTIEERLAALITRDAGDASPLAYEDEWYRVMLQQSQGGDPEGGDASTAT